MILFYIYAFVMGFLMMFFPEQMWKLQHWFSVKNGEPSDAYLTISRITGAIVWIGLIFFILYVNRTTSPGGLPW